MYKGSPAIDIGAYPPADCDDFAFTSAFASMSMRTMSVWLFAAASTRASVLQIKRLEGKRRLLGR